MVSEEQVWEKLQLVIDPEMGINVVDMGLIYRVELRDGVGGDPGGIPDQVRDENSIDNVKKEVFILMTLTSPACPLAGVFDELVGGAIRQIEGVEKVEIELTFDPVWTIEMISEAGRAELGMF